MAQLGNAKVFEFVCNLPKILVIFVLNCSNFISVALNSLNGLSQAKHKRHLNFCFPSRITQNSTFLTRLFELFHSCAHVISFSIIFLYRYSTQATQHVSVSFTRVTNDVNYLMPDLLISPTNTGHLTRPFSPSQYKRKKQSGQRDYITL